jgi:hypothetical protein
VQADGNGSKVDSRIRTGDHAGHSRVLRNLCACTVYYFDLTHRVKANKGAAGVDDQSIEDFEKKLNRMLSVRASDWWRQTLDPYRNCPGK